MKIFRLDIDVGNPTTKRYQHLGIMGPPDAESEWSGHHVGIVSEFFQAHWLREVLDCEVSCVSVIWLGYIAWLLGKSSQT